ncbi:MAG: hypothetical protein VB099_04740 [Candidatus Limiplasma sp.]|nr:hypothetical protein [Candidatus Limiplasma sp.]
MLASRFLPSFLRRPRLLVALFFGLLTLIGLLTSGDYGLACDEDWEQDILRENLKEYALWLGDSRAVDYYSQLGIRPISQSTEGDHGQSAYYLAAPLLPLKQTAPHVLLALWHGYTWLWFMAGCWAVYGFCREIGQSRGVACLCVLLLYLSPRFFAEGHYNNKDMVLLSLFLLTLWLGLRLLKQPGLLRGVLFSLAGAMAANTKIVGAAPWGLVGLAVVVSLTAQRAWTPSKVRAALGTLLSFAVFYALLTPALWHGPGEYLAYVLRNASGFSRWPGVVLFRGMIYDHGVNPLPRRYLPYMMLVTLPLYTLPLAAIGQWKALLSFCKAKAAALKESAVIMLPVLTLLWLAPLGYAMATKPLVYNGWRHFDVVFAPVVLLAGIGLDTLAGLWERRAWLRRGACALLCLCFAFTALGMGLNHPYQYGYYNLLLRNTDATQMELDYWVVSTVNAMKELAASPRDTRLPLVLGAREPMSLFGVVHGHGALSPALQATLTVTEEEDAPYLFSNATYARIYGTPAPQGYHPLLTIRSYGKVLATLYEKDP